MADLTSQMTNNTSQMEFDMFQMSFYHVPDEFAFSFSGAALAIFEAVLTGTHVNIVFGINFDFT